MKRKSRETFVMDQISNNYKKIAQSQRHLRSFSLGTLRRAGDLYFF